MLIRLPYDFKPRGYQKEMMEAVLDGCKIVVWIIHRRGGKTLTVVNLASILGVKRRGTVLHGFPQLNQARRVIWRGMDKGGRPFLDYMHPDIILKKNATEMSIDLINGSVYQLAGSNNYDAHMGSNPMVIIHDEFSLHDPLANEYFSPILAENEGVDIKCYTPRGKNHGYTAYLNALSNPKAYVRRLTVEDTYREDGRRIITDEMIEEERKKGIPDERIKQEYYCDFNVGVVGAYYTAEMDKMEKEGRIGVFPIDPDTPVWTIWDLGVGDSQAIWFMQPAMDGLCNMIYYYENNTFGIEHYIEELKTIKNKLGFKTYDSNWAPHDIKVREWSSGRSRIAVAADKGIFFRRHPIGRIADRIQATRTLFPKIRIHSQNCLRGINCLREYRREWDEVNMIFNDKPAKGWPNHGADAFGYFCEIWSDLYTVPSFNSVRKYDIKSQF